MEAEDEGEPEPDVVEMESVPQAVAEELEDSPPAEDEQAIEAGEPADVLEEEDDPTEEPGADAMVSA